MSDFPAFFAIMVRQLRKIMRIFKNMPVEATDIDQPFDAPSAEPDAEPDIQDAPHTAQDAPQSPPQSPKQKRGRPAGSKDKQPRKRPVRAVSLQRPVTRRSAPPRKATKRVQIESASEASESASEVESPRTVRHRQYIEHRQQKHDAHQANVNRYVALFDRMLA